MHPIGANPPSCIKDPMMSAMDPTNIVIKQPSSDEREWMECAFRRWYYSDGGSGIFLSERGRNQFVPAVMCLQEEPLTEDSATREIVYRFAVPRHDKDKSMIDARASGSIWRIGAAFRRPLLG